MHEPVNYGIADKHILIAGAYRVRAWRHKCERPHLPFVFCEAVL